MIIAFSGAGISQESGIPTFENQSELREKLTRDYANDYPKEYNEAIRHLKENIQYAKPNDAHIVLAKYHIPVITMNIDGLHKMAGSDVLELHGVLPEDDELDKASLLTGKPILYGDVAPNYKKAIELVSELGKGDIFLVIGASNYTEISRELRELAYINGAKIVEIQENATVGVRSFLERCFTET